MRLTVRSKPWGLGGLLCLLLAAAILLPQHVAVRAWSGDPTQNTAICTAPGDQRHLEVVSDGSGGAIVTWTDSRSGTNDDIYAQKVDSGGNLPDTTSPTVTLSSTATSPTSISPILITATFSQAFTGFAIDDITVGNGSASDFVAVSSAVYTFNVTPAGEGVITVDVAAGVAQNTAGNSNTAATRFSITYSTIESSPPGYWAVIIGIANYAYLDNLWYSVDDAQALYDKLSPVWGEDNVLLLADSYASKSAINDAILNWLAPLEGRDDTVLIYFSGHGLQYSGHEYLLPWDSLTYSYDNDIRDDEFAGWLSQLESQNQVVILDSCNSGGFIDELSGSGRVILTACAADEASWQSHDLGHGAFSYYILEAMDNLALVDSNDNHEISAEELYDYAMPRATTYMASAGYEQHPQIYDGYSDELVLLRTAVTTLDVSPCIAPVTVDGVEYAISELPVSLLFIKGTSHTVAVSTRTEEGVRETRYTFTSWSDNATEASRTISIEGPLTYTANYRTEHYLDVISVRGNPQGAGWYEEGTTAYCSISSLLESGTNTRYVFTGWSGDVNQTSNELLVVMNSPSTVTANWKVQYMLTIDVEHSDVPTPDGNGWYEKDTTVNVRLPSTVSVGSGTRYVFSGWVVDGAMQYGNPITITMNAGHTVVAKHMVQYYLNVESDKGTPQGEGWYDAGDHATFSVESPLGTIVRQVFDAWAGHCSETTCIYTIRMDGPKTVTANWRTDYTHLYIIAIVGAVLAAAVFTAVILAMRRRQE